LAAVLRVMCETALRIGEAIEVRYGVLDTRKRWLDVPTEGDKTGPVCHRSGTRRDTRNPGASRRDETAEAASAHS